MQTGIPETAAEYRLYADEYRALALCLPAGEGREQLLDIAAIWDQLAAEREFHAEPLRRAA